MFCNSISICNLLCNSICISFFKTEFALQFNLHFLFQNWICIAIQFAFPFLKQNFLCNWICISFFKIKNIWLLEKRKDEYRKRWKYKEEKNIHQGKSSRMEFKRKKMHYSFILFHSDSAQCTCWPSEDFYLNIIFKHSIPKRAVHMQPPEERSFTTPFFP